MFPQQDPYGVRYSVSRANSLSICLCLPESPKNGSSYEMGNNIRSTEPHAVGWPTYSGVRPGSPVGIVEDNAISNPVPCSSRHDTFHLDWGRPEPRQPASVVAVLNRVYPPHLLPPPT